MSTNASPENLVRMATAGLNLDTPPSEGEIRQILTGLAAAFGATKDAVDLAERMLHARFAIRMQMGETLSGPEEHESWLDAARASITPFYWDRYYEFLLRDDWPPLVANTLSRSMNELLDLCGNPRKPGHWKRRGLVVGDVQSGKTASYSALICKAADAGYRMVILLSGTLENVRRQTQERLDASFVGLDSRDFLARNQLKHKTYIGVGKINSERDGIVFTSSDRDFKADIATQLNLSLRAVNEPVLVVAKKHRSVLTNLAAWLRTRNAERDGKIDLPLLLIDDEADNASINTRNRPNQTTAINAAIRELLSLFTRSSYVGFTATPFANIFVDPDTTDQMIGDDLFPRDFIHLLQPPDNYVGMDRLFGDVDPDDIEASEASSSAAGIRTIEDSDAWLPVDHDRTDDLGEIPESLRDALRHYLISCAVRDLRARAAGRPEKYIHRSMLVNVSRFTDMQNDVANQIDTELEAVRSQVRLYGKLSPAEAARQSPEIAALEAHYAAEFTALEFGWSDVLSNLHEAISPIRVQPVNQSTGSKALDYKAVKEPPGLRVIAVGGNSLSRGLTVEDLCVSYFLRNSKAYDTLLQMGRWFGYRPGYQDLCRIWMTEEAENWYRHICDATGELKADFRRMARQKSTPAEFGLRVRLHPGTLLITARNKMATGVDMEVQIGEADLGGQDIETPTLPAEKNRNVANFDAVDQLVSTLIREQGLPARSPTGNALVWYRVPAETLIRFLESYAVHPFNHDFQTGAIIDFLAGALASNDKLLSHWTVAVPNAGDGGEVKLPNAPELQISAKRRRVVHRKKTPQHLMVSGKSARVGSTADVKLGMSVEEIDRITRRAKEEDDTIKDLTGKHFRRHMEAPLLVVYLLRGYERAKGQKGKDGTPYRDGLVLPALAMHFPGDGGGTRRTARYRLNLVAQAELEFDGDDLDEEAEDAD